MSTEHTPTAPPAAASPSPPTASGKGQRPLLEPPMSGVLIREWHTMTPVEQHLEWTDLRTWVIWLHDQYELSKEERLPLCWHLHPGLVEELRSLKAWREAIYDTPDTRGAAHAARSWHGELRQTIAAATTFWARGCRAGHKPAQPAITACPKELDEWRQAQPPLMASSLPLRRVIDDEDMEQLLGEGTGSRHTGALSGHVSLAGTWWQQDGDCQPWRRVVDPTHQATLDDARNRLRQADAAASTANRPQA